MEKADLNSIISQLSDKLDLLSSYNKKLLSDNDDLQNKIDTLTAQNIEQQSELDALRRRIETSQLSDSFIKASGSKKQARYVVKSILREIDDCIALINK
ncbi:MAG: hypothetical protein R3Y04_02465 [Rikenellaceae bacterium]